MKIERRWKITPFKEQTQNLARKLFYWTVYSLAFIALIRLYFCSSTLPHPSPNQLHLPSSPIAISTSSSSSATSLQEDKRTRDEPPPSCDYSSGKWVSDLSGPLYNGTSCATIKDGQNCMAHGRPDLEYLQWRWKPHQCPLPRFDPDTFLTLLAHKHIAFVGDSMARNQLESLLCMLSSVSPPNLVYTHGDDNKFRRWHFPGQNVSLSLYWSPFLVKGVEKSNTGPNHNVLYLDSVNERWADDLGDIDLVVLSIGHWFLHPAVFHEGDTILGCHFCGSNHTQIGFYDALRKALRTSLRAVTDRTRVGNRVKNVFLTTFSPSHFEGEWDKYGSCSKTMPYDEEGEKVLGYMDEEIRKIELEEVAAGKANVGDLVGFKLDSLDVTKLSFLRPDGHPGPYMYPFPFAEGIKDRVQNDCVHWCLPGPIDTWNEILLEVVKKWNGE